MSSQRGGARGGGVKRTSSGRSPLSAAQQATASPGAGIAGSSPGSALRPPKPPLVKNRGYKETDGGRQRFLMELEFVHCLANPTYINYLAQNRFFDDPAFINYLDYLQYWLKPEYAQFVIFPHALYFLELLQFEKFRSAMAYPASREFVHRQQYFHWLNYRNNRLKALAEHLAEEDTSQPQSGEGAAAQGGSAPENQSTAADAAERGLGGGGGSGRGLGADVKVKVEDGVGAGVGTTRRRGQGGVTPSKR